MSTSVHPSYPVHVDAELETHLSRWLWLVKWVLVLPHYFVLAFLWLAFALLSVVAFFAILFTGRYPRPIFDFNVGVLRWSWRVGYYAYAALGTDRYPPFTLNEVPGYPAHLTVDYPEHLSRGLVLVKWWLLAIPHYLIVGILAGSGAYVAWDATDSDVDWVWGGGLIGLLVLVAAVVLAVTGTYPRQLFDLVLGLNRWVVRVAAYAGLMTDEYPPFRLDQGGADPDAPARLAVPAGPAPAPLAAPREWSAGRVVALAAAGAVFLVAGGLITAGLTLGVAGQVMRDDAGFIVVPEQSVATSGYAVVSEPLELDAGSAGDVLPRSVLGDALVRVSSDSGPVFVGIASAADAAAYLDGVAYTTLLRFERVEGVQTPVYRERAGGSPGLAPTESDIWVASETGTGTQRLTWEAESGDWVVVLMNADAAASVSADVAVGATVPVLGWIVVGLLVSGALMLLLAIGIALAALYSGRQGGTPPGTQPPSQPATSPPAAPPVT